jgi:3-deoxy-manno-octulosonate cytidylyltransferase (CMP-KDO synthetase)
VKKALGVIPARYASSRFPGKALAELAGKPLLQWVYEAAARSASLDRLIIATDDQRIYQRSLDFGAETVLTSPHHPSGTDRVAEVARKFNHQLIINIQGDEPLLHSSMIDALVTALQEENVPMVTLARAATEAEDFFDPNTVKVVVNHQGYALYFSRSPIPYASRGSFDFFWQHIGLYGYQREFLLQFVQLPRSPLEEKERLEQLRALENGFAIKIIPTSVKTLSVDTPEDIIRVEKILKNRKSQNA